MKYFSARLVTGRGRGRTIGTPTLNVDLNDVPVGIPEGIYAGWTRIDGFWTMAAIHYGPRPVFQDSVSFEIHLLDIKVMEQPERIEIVLVERLRAVLNFNSVEELITQINQDIEQTRGILTRHGPPDDQELHS